MIEDSFGGLEGLRFLEKNGTPILACGRMVDFTNCLVPPGKFKREYILQENQRIVGFKSDSGRARFAMHRDFQFVLMGPMTKTVLLKLLVNK
jgi:hypothetical protein